MLKKIAIVLLILLIIATGTYVVLSSQKQEPATLIGRWVHDDNGAVYTFHNDGTVEIELPKLTPYTANYIMDEASGTLEIQLIVDSQIQRQESAYFLEGNTLTLTSSLTGSVVTMTRQPD
ncbi:MAG: hypothetical protein E7328_00220 [Clostridiales bacterium]|nr:hypothetical protein [Clostridiales bacterium]